jgi:nucleotide-binding universal stress UspA family protein
MRKLLIPTDFSKNAMNAISYALETFKYEYSEFFIMHAYADEVYETKAQMSRSAFEELKETIHNKSLEKLDKTLKNIKKISPNPRHQYSIIISFGTLIDVANEIVDRENIDVVIMGTKGETDDREITFGSNTVQILKYVKSPVLAIPSEYPNHPPKNILFPTDFLLPYKRRELKLASTLAKSFAAKINFLYLSKFENLSYRQEDNKAFLENIMSENFKYFHNVTGEDLSATINNFIKELDINLLVMVNSRHSFLENILYLTTIDKIGLKIKIPFLILQNLPR